MKTTNDIYGMELHEELKSTSLEIVRVAGGWIYKDVRANSVPVNTFIPLDYEFQKRKTTNTVEEKKKAFEDKWANYFKKIPLQFFDELDELFTQHEQAIRSEDLDKAWEYMVKATRAESWSKKELKEALNRDTTN